MHLVKKMALRLCDCNVTPTNVKILRFIGKPRSKYGVLFWEEF